MVMYIIYLILKTDIITEDTETRNLGPKHLAG